MRHLVYAAAATLFAGLALPSAPAHAILLAQYSTNNGASFQGICADPNPGGACGDSFTTSNGLTFLSFGATSNSPGTATNADLLSTSLRISNPTSTTESVLLSIGATDFTSPTAPPTATFLNNISGTVITGGADNALTSIACIDQGNGQNNCGLYATPPIVADITQPGAGSATTTTPVPLLNGPFSMTELISFTLSPGALINYSSSSDLSSNNVSEPGTIAILGTALLGLGMISRRKRNTLA